MKQFNLGEYLANPSRKVVTRDGRVVTRFLCTDRKNLRYPIVALVENKLPEGECIVCYTKEGKIFNDVLTDVDLFFAPEKKEGWINIFKVASNDNRFVGGARIFKSKEEAEEAREGVNGYITTMKIEWEEE